MKILITGGTTFVSKYTAEYFVSFGNDVVVLNRGSREQVKVLNIYVVTEHSREIH